MVDPSEVPSYTFVNGHTIPVIGLYTRQLTNDSAYCVMRDALDSGYRHIDCAYMHQNQVEIGHAIADAIADGVVTREELFITSKIWPTHFRKERVLSAFRQIMSELQLQYLDLLLLHFPASFQQQDEQLFPIDPNTGDMIDGKIDYLEAYRVLESLVDQGLVKSIGVANFNVDQMRRLVKSARIKPVTNQVELNPYLIQQELKNYCNRNGIVLTSYSAFGNPEMVSNGNRLLQEEVVNRLAGKYCKNSGQILIKFQIQSGNLVVVSSGHRNRIMSNIQVFDFDLSETEINELASLNRNQRTIELRNAAHLINYPFL